MPKDKVKNLFISHVHKDDESVTDVKDLIGSKGYTIRDSSIVSEKPNQAKSPDYIKTGILAPRIEWAGTMIVLISPNTHTSDWVNWEIEYAHKNDTRVVGVWLQGAKESDLPEAFEKYGDALVGWHGDSIASAIEGEDNWVTPNGKSCARRTITRYSCG